jgi:sigma-E factor negative regulatory protein RseC
MLEETAVVVKTDNEYAWVETQRKSTCGSCSVNKGCGTAVLSKVIGNKFARLKVRNTLPAEVNDTVVIGIKESALVQGSLAVYFIPLLCMFFGGLFGETLGRHLAINGDSLSIILAFIGLGGGFFWLRFFVSKSSKDDKFQAVILRKVDQMATILPASEFPRNNI